MSRLFCRILFAELLLNQREFNKAKLHRIKNGVVSGCGLVRVLLFEVPSDTPIATIHSLEGCSWGDSTLPTAVGRPLHARRMRLLSGTVRTDLRNTRLTLQRIADLRTGTDVHQNGIMAFFLSYAFLTSCSRLFQH